jgi:hypothetical protein
MSGEGPLVDAPPHHRLDGHPEPSCPLLVVRRKANAATYAAVHEPYSDRSIVRNVSLIHETGEGLGIKVEGDEFSDRLLVGFGSSSGTILLRSRDGEEFRFAGYGYVRTTGQSVVARGKFDGFRVRAKADETSLMVNGKSEPAVVRDGFVVYGNVTGEKETAVSPAPTEKDETRASVHSFFYRRKFV